MFTIAICDNEERELETSRQLIEECLKSLPEFGNEKYQLTEYSNGKDLVEDMKQGSRFDVFFLDVLMPQMSGIELGKLLRERNIQTPIIYTTYAREFAFEAFDNQALDYLEKPLGRARLERALKRVLQNRERRQVRPYHINSREGVRVVNLNDILYVENVSRSPVFFCRDGSTRTGVSVRTTFEKSVGIIAMDKDFVQPHKSFFVNMHYIHLMRTDGMQMDDGREIPVSRERSAMVRTAYLNFLAEQEG